jgi:hypothetical protein
MYTIFEECRLLGCGAVKTSNPIYYISFQLNNHSHGYHKVKCVFKHNVDKTQKIYVLECTQESKLRQGDNLIIKMLPFLTLRQVFGFRERYTFFSSPPYLDQLLRNQTACYRIHRKRGSFLQVKRSVCGFVNIPLAWWGWEWLKLHYSHTSYDVAKQEGNFTFAFPSSKILGPSDATNGAYIWKFSCPSEE